MATKLGARALSPRGHLLSQSTMHAVNDALFSGVYPLLPLVAAELSLSYAQVGAIRTAYSGASAVFQLPAGLAAERYGEQALLALGTGWTGLGLCAAALLGGGFLSLLALALLAGLGGNPQHPIATAIISRVFEGPRRATAIGTLNFAGDLGKVAAPAVAGLAIAAYGWRGGFLALGGIGALFALVYWAVIPSRRPGRSDGTSESRPHPGPPPEAEATTPRGWGIARPGLFVLLTIVGCLDATGRTTLLTFAPFLLGQHGFDAASIGLAYSAIYAAGAAGKFVCGPLADRFGNTALIVATELITAGGVMALLHAPSALIVLALVPLGFGLNGTSSVLYAAVPAFFHAERRARGYGLYFTCIDVAGAAAPILYGALADQVGVAASLTVLAASIALIAPLALLLRR
jgi:FSR family fosmidomycin resistance protein-like MFS transporter